MSSIEMEWLPMGSVVMLRETDKPLMIIGRMQRQVEINKAVYGKQCN